jgi:hypothetical protein
MSSGFPLQEYYSRIYKTYDLVNQLFTFGQDRNGAGKPLRHALRIIRNRYLTYAVVRVIWHWVLLWLRKDQ